MKAFVEQLSPRLRTWAMLCLNCGMTAADLGTLFWKDGKLSLAKKVTAGGHEITVWGLLDPKTWTIRRRRCKTGKNGETPTVVYKLWPETVELLKGLDREPGRLVFATEIGSPMYLAEYSTTTASANKVLRRSLFGDYWRGKEIPLGKFRSIAATTLKKDKFFRPYKDYFLAHVPRETSDEYYSKEQDDPFFEALEFIRHKVFGTPFRINSKSKRRAG